MIRLVLVLLLLFTLPTHAEEKILKFISDIHVQKDASLDVTETIQVNAEQNNIRHGIIRILPTSFRDTLGKQHSNIYTIQAIYLDDTPAPYHIKKQFYTQSIYIGDKNKILDHGIYTYVIKYHVTHAIAFLADKDELYWNITGNAWQFPIMEAQAHIYLPTGTPILNYASYTGPAGAKDNHSYSIPGDSQITFATSGPLPSESGLTVSIAWPKGIIHRATNLELLKENLWDNNTTFILLEITLLVFGYYFIAWYYNGRDPKKGTIIPLFAPPPNFSPAAVRFIVKMECDMIAFTAAIVSMAVKGFITIKNTQDEYQLNRTSTPADACNLAEEESALANELFKEKNSIKLNYEYQAEINAAKKSLKKTLTKTYQNKYFITNLFYFIPGAMLSALAFVTLMVCSNASIDDLTHFIISISILILYFYYKIISSGGMLHVFWLGSFVIAFLMIGFTSIYKLPGALPLFDMSILFFIIFLNILFYYLLKAPTLEGRKVLDKIDGFKLYLATTEQDRLNQLNPPTKTPELFEKYLPYAIALRVENKWGQQFTGVLQAATHDQTAYQPIWYTGSSSVSFYPAIFVGALSAGIASTIASASGGGSGGGGFSGGGGGGGGGGGW